MLRISLRGIKENIYPHFIPGWRPSSTTTLVFKNMPYVCKRGLLNRNYNNYFFFLKYTNYLKVLQKKQLIAPYQRYVFSPRIDYVLGLLGKIRVSVYKTHGKTYFSYEWVSNIKLLLKKKIGRKWKKPSHTYFFN